jgi:copper chaperone CopZ
MTPAMRRPLAIGAALALCGLGLVGGGGRRDGDPAAAQSTLGSAAFYQGRCARLDPAPLYPLGEVALGSYEEDAATTAVSVGMATTTLDARLADLLAGEHAITVDRGTEDRPTPISCGEVVGPAMPDGVAVGLREQDGSGYAGIAWLRADGERTAVTVFLAHGLTGTVGGNVEPAAAAITFHVPTITCPACPLRVEASVRKAPGILAVAFDGQDVTVTYDPSRVSPETIRAAIEAGGDTIEPAEG